MIPDAECRISEAVQEGLRVITIDGAVNTATSPEIRDVLSAKAREGLFVVVDLEQVSDVDSMGLITLALASKRLHGSGGAMYIVGLPAEVAKVLRISGVDQSLSIYDDVASAIAASRARAGPALDG